MEIIQGYDLENKVDFNHKVNTIAKILLYMIFYTCRLHLWHSHYARNGAVAFFSPFLILQNIFSSRLPSTYLHLYRNCFLKNICFTQSNHREQRHQHPNSVSLIVPEDTTEPWVRDASQKLVMEGGARRTGRVYVNDFLAICLAL